MSSRFDRICELPHIRTMAIGIRGCLHSGEPGDQITSFDHGKITCAAVESHLQHQIHSILVPVKRIRRDTKHIEPPAANDAAADQSPRHQCLS